MNNNSAKSGFYYIKEPVSQRLSIISNRRLMLWIVFTLALNISSIRAEKFSFDISYELNDFEISQGEDNQLQVFPKQNFPRYWYGPANTPSLPHYPYNYSSNGCHSFREFQINRKDSILIASGIEIAHNPNCMPAGDITSNNFSAYTDAENTSNKNSNNCLYFTGSSNWSDLTIFHFVVSPFEYDVQTGNLYFIKHLSIEFEVSDYTQPQEPVAISPQFIRDKEWDNSNYNSRNKIKAPAPDNGKADLNYLIVTNNEIKKTFEPLLVWKRTKGLKAEIVSTEEISAKYPDNTFPLPLKIKKFLYDKYTNEGLSYVLLGGDDKVVPSLKCYCSANGQISENIPVDQYYACFDGPFTWDANNNGIYGEWNDSINFTPSIFVSRIPTRTVEETAQYVKKVLEYETAPRWNNNILMGGEKLYSTYTSGQSDAEVQSGKLYEYIASLWDGQRVRLFDTCTDVEPLHFTRDGLIDQMSMGYGYIDIVTHGSQIYWNMGDNFYNAKNGSSQNNRGHSVILTSACDTNAFDCPYDEPRRSYSNDPCLSESLIRNYNSGVIAYWGSSRKSWVWKVPANILFPSLEMEKPFYEYLFGNELKSKNFAKLTTLAKYANIQQAYSDPTYRWLQLSMNAIGDPEMCLYTTTPKTFESMNISYSDNSIQLATGSDNCRICVMSETDKGLSFHRVFDNVSSVTLTEIPDYASICITKQDYIPKHFTVRFVQDITIDSDTKIKGDIVRIGANANPTHESGDVNFIGGNIIVEGKTIEVLEGVNIEKGASVDFKNIK